MEENMMNEVTEETLVGEIVMNHPEAIDVLLSIGMHCLGCPASQGESLAEACMVHGYEPSAVVDAINERIANAQE